MKEGRVRDPELKARLASRSMFNKRTASDTSPLYLTNSSSFSILLMKVSVLSHISLHIRTMHLHILSIPVSGTYLPRCYVDVSESGVTFEYYLFLRGWVISPRQVVSSKNACITNSHNKRGAFFFHRVFDNVTRLTTAVLNWQWKIYDAHEAFKSIIAKR